MTHNTYNIYLHRMAGVTCLPLFVNEEQISWRHSVKTTCCPTSKIAKYSLVLLTYVKHAWSKNQQLSILYVFIVLISHFKWFRYSLTS
jgi:hypothetical protein